MASAAITADEIVGLLGAWQRLRRSRHRALAAAIDDLAGGRLPAERALAAGLGVSRGTVVADRFVAVAARHGVAVVPGIIAGVDGVSRHFLRIAFSLPEPVLATGAERLARPWEALGSAVGTPYVPTPV